MRDGQGYEILHNGVPRTFRDRRETALEAARFAKSNAKGDIGLPPEKWSSLMYGLWPDGGLKDAEEETHG